MEVCGNFTTHKQCGWRHTVHMHVDHPYMRTVLKYLCACGSRRVHQSTLYAIEVRSKISVRTFVIHTTETDELTYDLELYKKHENNKKMSDGGKKTILNNIEYFLFEFTWNQHNYKFTSEKNAKTNKNKCFARLSTSPWSVFTQRFYSI